MEFDFDEYTIRVRDDEHWREMLDGMAREMFEEVGADTDTEEFYDFKYDVLEGVVLDVIGDAIREAADDDRLKLDNFKDFFDRIAE